VLCTKKRFDETVADGSARELRQGGVDRRLAWALTEVLGVEPVLVRPCLGVRVNRGLI